MSKWYHKLLCWLDLHEPDHVQTKTVLVASEMHVVRTCKYCGVMYE